MTTKPLTTATADKAAQKAEYYMMFEGLNISDLAELFGCDKKKIYAAVGKVKPSGERRGAPIYRVKEVAPYLVKPLVDVEEYIKKLRPNDLPPLLQSEFWKGQRIRMQFMEDSKQLWRTERVQQVLALIFKIVRQTAGVFDDTVERQVGLSTEQKKVVRALADSLVTEMRDAIVEEFSQWAGEVDKENLILDMNTVLGVDAEELIAQIDDEEL